MRSGHIISIIVILFTALGTWGDYKLISRTDTPHQYIWTLWINAIMIIPLIGLMMHKNWGRITLKIILWLGLGAAFFLGLAVANAGSDKGVMTSAIASLRSHWLLFIVYGGLLFYMNTEKVKKDFGVKVEG
ncbi:MAG TPA: hypothetical protein VL651_01345 [Bacteroidia bacterium]|jgi:hypothetical protein|nr:hypothetical protein [Bacteroidia bacterium]